MNQYRSPPVAKSLLNGMAQIIAVPGMGRTWRAIDAGSASSDWRAIGDDLRRSMQRTSIRADG
ncbi:MULTISPECIES: hypothetical protein [unclassified Sphingomonas]|uniref:hypothetical protein n=1 Tax=unclassified Sphingomonas TaxID=196159 RepID=UPI000A69383C|nr:MULTISPECIES: hypothetical protein [unclassified Sphingomonas]